MKRVILAVFLAIFAFALVACNSSDKGSENTETAETEGAEEAGTIRVEHELDSTEVKKNPQNVVVFDFGILDTLDTLGVDIAGLPQMNVPSYLEKYSSSDYENLGSLKEPDFEKIAQIGPELIIISTRQAEIYDQFAEIAPTIFIAHDTTNYVESFKENTILLAEIFGKEAEVEQHLADIDAKVADVKAKAEETGYKGLIVLANDDKISAYGPGSRFGLIHDDLGVAAADDGIEVSQHGMNVSFEYVADQNPDILFVIDRSAAIGEGASAEELVENPLVERTEAFKNERIAYLDPEYWYLASGGLQSMMKMVEEIEASLE